MDSKNKESSRAELKLKKKIRIKYWILRGAGVLARLDPASPAKFCVSVIAREGGIETADHNFTTANKMKCNAMKQYFKFIMFVLSVTHSGTSHFFHAAQSTSSSLDF